MKFGTCASFVFFIPGWMPPPLSERPPLVRDSREAWTTLACAILSWIDLHDILVICQPFCFRYRYAGMMHSSFQYAFSTSTSSFVPCSERKSIWDEFNSSHSCHLSRCLSGCSQIHTGSLSGALFFSFILIRACVSSQQLQIQLWFSISDWAANVKRTPEYISIIMIWC